MLTTCNEEESTFDFRIVKAIIYRREIIRLIGQLYDSKILYDKNEVEKVRS
jgi:hypothetical protein